MIRVSRDTLERNPDLAEHLTTGGRSRRPAGAASEASEQIALIDWRNTVVGQEPRLAWLYHTPNGELREKLVAARLKAMGVSAGVPDLLLPVRARGFVGCAIELKAIGGEASAEQLGWVGHLREQGWSALVITGWVAAARHLCWYLDRDPVELGLEGAHV